MEQALRQHVGESDAPRLVARMLQVLLRAPRRERSRLEQEAEIPPHDRQGGPLLAGRDLKVDLTEVEMPEGRCGGLAEPREPLHRILDQLHAVGDVGGDEVDHVQSFLPELATYGRDLLEALVREPGQELGEAA